MAAVHRKIEKDEKGCQQLVNGQSILFGVKLNKNEFDIGQPRLEISQYLYFGAFRVDLQN